MKNFSIKEISILFFLAIVLFLSSINTIPVLDRDEARFVQASKQMFETSDYVNIKFQEEYRSKKPIGIYWLQAGLINFLSEKKSSIWSYRLISSMAAILSILTLYFLTNKFFGIKVGFYSALILSCGLLFIIESHIAKTDSVLLTLSTIVMLLLLGYYRGSYKNQIGYSFFLWGTIGLSILIKGPVLPFIVILSIVTVILLDKKGQWFYNTKPLLGVLIVICINLPWFLLMSEGQFNSFINEGIKVDFIGKIISVKESHNAFFGAHLLSLLILFFPMSFFFFPLFFKIKENYKVREYRFLLAWIIPGFLIFELIPTKLPHYTLPFYPAISILMGNLINEQNNDYFFKKISIFGYFLYFLAGSFIVTVLTLGVIEYGEFGNFFIFLAIILPILKLIGIYTLFKKGVIWTFYYKITLACLFSVLIFFSYLPNMEKIWVSRKIVNTLVSDNDNLVSHKIATIGYNEPSLVFEVGSDISVIRNESFLSKNVKKYEYLITEKLYYNKVIEIFDANDINYNVLNQFEGFNPAKNKKVMIFIFKIYQEL